MTLLQYAQAQRVGDVPRTQPYPAYLAAFFARPAR